MDEPYFLTTSRIGFRYWTKDDMPLAHALWGSPEVTRFFTANGLNKTQIQQRLNSELEMQHKHGIQYWPIFLRENGEHIGCCGLRPKDIEAGVLEFGVHLRPEHWGSGLAIEAGKAAIEYAFTELKVRQLFAGHHPENQPSKRMLGKLGFSYSGDELYPPTGLQHPSYIYRSADYKRPPLI